MGPSVNVAKTHSHCKVSQIDCDETLAATYLGHFVRRVDFHRLLEHAGVVTKQREKDRTQPVPNVLKESKTILVVAYNQAVIDYARVISYLVWMTHERLQVCDQSVVEFTQLPI